MAQDLNPFQAVFGDEEDDDVQVIVCDSDEGDVEKAGDVVVVFCGEDEDDGDFCDGDDGFGDLDVFGVDDDDFCDDNDDFGDLEVAFGVGDDDFFHRDDRFRPHRDHHRHR